MTTPTTSDAVLVGQFRKALALVAAAFAAGMLVELTTLRHWTTPAQFVPWVVLLLVLAGAGVLLRAPVAAGAVRFARWVGVLTALTAGVGVFLHIQANLRQGALLPATKASWPTMSGMGHLWAAATGGAGLNPPLVPGTLALAGVLLALATLGLTAKA